MPTRIPESMTQEMERTNRAWRKKKEDASGWKSVAMTIAEIALGGEPGSPEQMAGGAMGLSGPVAYSSVPEMADAVVQLILKGQKKGVDENVLQGLAGLNRALHEGRISKKTVEHIKKIDFAPKKAFNPNTIGDSGPVRYKSTGQGVHDLTPHQAYRWSLYRNEYANKFKLPPAGHSEGIQQYINLNPKPDLSSSYTTGLNVDHIARVTPLHETKHVYFAVDPASASDPVYLTAREVLEGNPNMQYTPFGWYGQVPTKNMDALYGLRSMSDNPGFHDLYTGNYITNPNEFLAEVGANRDLFQMYGPGPRVPLSNAGAQGALFPDYVYGAATAQLYEDALAREVAKLKLKPGGHQKMNELLLGGWYKGK